VLVQEMGGTLHTIAKDVKVQVEFNPARVAAYRLIGYENRLLRREDFDDDRKDAGEMGAGHTVTALYEVVPVGAVSEAAWRGVDSLRYQHVPATTAVAGGDELMFVKLRYKEPAGASSRLLQHAVRARASEPSLDFAFASAVAELGMLLRDSPHRGSASLAALIARAEDALGRDEGGYRKEFVELARALQRKELLAAR
jgi:Ca-activated chloride channel family protein